MAIGKTTPEQRAKLAAAGFVRVDGLMTIGEYGGINKSYIIKPDVKDLGMSGGNNGMTVIVTEGGEVWLAIGNSATIPAWEREGKSPRAELFQELCPRGSGVFVPCSNGEGLNWREILCRLCIPDWMPSH